MDSFTQSKENISLNRLETNHCPLKVNNVMLSTKGQHCQMALTQQGCSSMVTNTVRRKILVVFMVSVLKSCPCSPVCVYACVRVCVRAQWQMAEDHVYSRARNYMGPASWSVILQSVFNPKHEFIQI